MIYTVTLNPCLDYIVSVPDFRAGRVNRAKFDRIIPGGRGINVSYVLNILHEKNLALGFVAGFTGEEIRRLMDRDGINNNFVELKNGYSRIDVQMILGMESSINGVGPKVTAEDLDKLAQQLQVLEDGDTLVLSGASPRGARDTVYADLLRTITDKDIDIVVDAKGPLLLNTLKYHPFLIKPNRQEIIDIFYAKPNSIEDIIKYAKNLQSMGARNVLVSLSAEGAILITEDGNVYRHSAMSGEVRNTVGCGDSMIAGFLSGYSKNQDMIEAFQYSLAAASANAFNDGRGSYEEIQNLLQILQNEISDWN
ncbi:MAG: 1-phosphofructokinase family hexose kinase [Eubacteriales bacterium]|nr:1-phosphofructokinase family hexose kinase [Eubacteriales bacterium]